VGPGSFYQFIHKLMECSAILSYDTIKPLWKLIGLLIHLIVKITITTFQISYYFGVWIF
jgi:hypothetical protein